MSVIKSFFIAFSIYSKIPVPQFAWKEEDMRYTLCFFPWVGAVIGLCFLLWNRFAGVYGIPSTARAAVGAVLPLAISGGFHADGFMDTMDALHSYRDRERKLEILKDSHAGAFAIISCSVYLLAYTGIYSMLTAHAAKVIAISFMLSRTLSGLSVICFPQARKKGQGLVATFSESAEKRVNRRTLMIYLIVLSALMIVVGKWSGAAAVIMALLVFWYYHHMCIRKFGGVTGDLAGYFLQMCEILMALAVVVMEQILLLLK